MEYVNICFEHDDLGGMVVLQVYPSAMTEVDWYHVKCAMNIYAWQESVSELCDRIQGIIGEKGHCHLDQNLVRIGGEDAEEMYRDFHLDRTEITFYLQEI